jgi:hypothetical protein
MPFAAVHSPAERHEPCQSFFFDWLSWKTSHLIGWTGSWAMTHDILQSDLDVAIRLIRADGTDAEIVETLTARGVAPIRALQVARDLRFGKLVAPFNPAAPGVELRDMSDPTDEEPPQPRRTAPAPKRSVWGRESKSSGRKSKAPFWIVVFLGFCFAGGGGAVVYHIRIQRHLHDTSASDRSDSAPRGDDSTPSRSRPPEEPLPSSSAVLDLQADGLHLANALVNASNALFAISGVLGPPTRTNRLDQVGKIIYAYDHHGILLYAGEAAGADSVVLDYDGAGGTNGTLLPFAGTIKLGDNLVQAKTRSSDLAAIRQLNLSNPANDSGTFRGRCNNLDVFFAYLNGPARLSLVEINLKGR